MKSQEQILERMKTTPDVHGNALLFLFLDRSHQIEIMGSRIAKSLPLATRSEFREALDEDDLSLMLAHVSKRAQEISDERAHRIAGERLKALSWLAA